MLCFRKFLVAKKFEEKKLGLVSKFYVERFLSHSAEKFRRRTGNPSVLCFRKFLVAKVFMDEKGGVSQVSVGNFCLTVPTKFVGEPFNLSLASGTKIIYASEGYVTIIRRKIFVSQYRIISQRNPPLQCFRKFLVAKKFVEKKEEGGVLKISVENVLSGSAEKFRRGRGIF